VFTPDPAPQFSGNATQDNACRKSLHVAARRRLLQSCANIMLMYANYMEEMTDDDDK